MTSHGNKNELRLAVIDTETTGVDPQKHRVVEVAIQLATLNASGLHCEGDVRVFRQLVELYCNGPDDSNYELEALKINGYHEKHPDWANTPRAYDQENARTTTWYNAAYQWRDIVAMTAGRTMCAQGGSFDRDFVESELAVIRNSNPQEFRDLVAAWDKRWVDTRTLCAYEFVHTDKPLKSFSLHEIYAATGGPELPSHRAEADVRRCLWLMHRQSKRLFTP